MYYFDMGNETCPFPIKLRKGNEGLYTFYCIFTCEMNTWEIRKYAKSLHFKNTIFLFPFSRKQNPESSSIHNSLPSLRSVLKSKVKNWFLIIKSWDHSRKCKNVNICWFYAWSLSLLPPFPSARWVRWSHSWPPSWISTRWSTIACSSGSLWLLYSLS